MNGRYALIDGEGFAPADAKVSVYDRGFLYGDSVFETIRTYDGYLYALDDHLERLARSAEKMGITMPVSLAALAEEARRALAAAGNAESYVRIVVTRGSGPLGLATSLAERPLRVVIVEPLATPPREQYDKGISALCVQTVRASDAAQSAKLGNYLASALALREAHAAGASEALVVNRDGVVVEGTTSNVFAVISGKLVTPPLGTGVLDGITRGVVLTLAAELAIEVVYVALSPDEIVQADELFLTSSLRELMPVVTVDGKQIGDGRPGRVTRQLHRAFRARLGVAGRMPWEA